MDFNRMLHNLHRGHILSLIISYGLSTSVSSVPDLAVSGHYVFFFVFFNFTSFHHKSQVRMVRNP